MKNENFEKSRTRINSMDDIDVFRVVLWYSFIRYRLSANSNYQISRIVEPNNFRVNDHRIIYCDKKWRNYQNGLNVPNSKLLERVESIVEGSSLIINHVLWQALRDAVDIDLLLQESIGKLSWEVQRILYKSNKHDCDRKLVEHLSPKKLMQLERLASLDALAALVIFLRLGVLKSKGIVDISRAIYRTLLIICMKKPYSHFSESLILVMYAQVFSLADSKQSILGDTFKDDFLRDLQILRSQFSMIDNEKLVTNTWKKDVRISSDFLEKVRFHNLFKESTIMTVGAI